MRFGFGAGMYEEPGCQTLQDRERDVRSEGNEHFPLQPAVLDPPPGSDLEPDHDTSTHQELLLFYHGPSPRSSEENWCQEEGLCPAPA